MCILILREQEEKIPYAWPKYVILGAFQTFFPLAGSDGNHCFKQKYLSISHKLQ